MQDPNDPGTVEMDFEESKKAVVLDNPNVLQKVKKEEEKIKLEVLSYPNPILNKVVPEYGGPEEIQHSTEYLTELAEALTKKMYDNAGIGLAANQCGLDERMIVIDTEYPQSRRKKPLVMLNPEIVEASEEKTITTEGCLSVPFEFQGDVERPSKVKVVYFDLSGIEHGKECNGLEACCVQHEIDHLNGILFISYLSRVRRDMIRRKTDKFLRQFMKGQRKVQKMLANEKKNKYRGHRNPKRGKRNEEA